MNTWKRSKSLVLLVLLLVPLAAHTRDAEQFSFLVIGDTRTEPYLPPSLDQAGMEEILRQRYHKDGIKLELKDHKPFKATIPRTERPLVLHYEGKPWPQRIDQFHKNGYRQIYTYKGFDWVMDTVVKELNSAQATRPAFLIHGGDIVLNGSQGHSLSSPYWALMQNRLFMHLPKRVFAVVGNHETWDDENIEGMMATMPWLKDTGFRVNNRIYSFDKKNNRFIFLNSGPQCDSEHGDITDWCSTYPDYHAQMTFLRKEFESAKKNNISNIFVTYHKPSFIQVGHDPLPPEKNPHSVLRSYADDFNIVVFNSHAHTTEHYLVDGIRYLVIGGGGAPQAFYPTNNPTKQTELYWQGAPREEEYNLVKISVSGSRIEAVLKRYRPASDTIKVRLFTMQND